MTYTESKKINNLYAYLKKTNKNEVVIRSLHVEGSFDDARMDASCAGFDAYVGIDAELAAKGKMPDYYRFVRK